jgi:hypothetical protein
LLIGARAGRDAKQHHESGKVQRLLHGNRQRLVSSLQRWSCSPVIASTTQRSLTVAHSAVHARRSAEGPHPATDPMASRASKTQHINPR